MQFDHCCLKTVYTSRDRPPPARPNGTCEFRTAINRSLHSSGRRHFSGPRASRPSRMEQILPTRRGLTIARCTMHQFATFRRCLNCKSAISPEHCPRSMRSPENGDARTGHPGKCPIRHNVCPRPVRCLKGRSIRRHRADACGMPDQFDAF